MLSKFEMSEFINFKFFRSKKRFLIKKASINPKLVFVRPKNERQQAAIVHCRCSVNRKQRLSIFQRKQAHFCHQMLLCLRRQLHLGRAKPMNSNLFSSSKRTKTAKNSNQQGR